MCAHMVSFKRVLFLIQNVASLFMLGCFPTVSTAYTWRSHCEYLGLQQCDIPLSFLSYSLGVLLLLNKGKQTRSETISNEINTE